MFSNPRYVTKGIARTIPFAVQLLMWNIIDTLQHSIQLDYLQVFMLSVEYDADGVPYQCIAHSQEVPPYQHSVTISYDHPVSCKVFCIDNQSHSTMLLADEY